jgi:DNA-binding NtrC family response regulator
MEAVLVVADEAGARSLMTRWVRAIGFEARSVCDAQQALHAMGTHPAALAVCDVCMPGHDGLWLARELHRRYPDTAVIVATSLPRLDPALTGDQAGSVEYLLKPFSHDQLRRAMERALAWRRSTVETRQWRRRLEEELRHRRIDLVDGLRRSRVSAETLGGTLLDLLAVRDLSARRHAGRVARVAVSLARRLGVCSPEYNPLDYNN